MYIKLRVTAGAKKEVVKKVSDDHYDIAVKEPAEQNRANRRVLEIMKEKLGVPRIRLVSGHHSGSKIIGI
jgi:uncharacterized protein